MIWIVGAISFSGLRSDQKVLFFAIFKAGFRYPVELAPAAVWLVTG
jgi:hypothetical protein